MKVKLQGIKDELWKHMHDSIPQQGEWLRQVVRGFFAYNAVPTNANSLKAFRLHVVKLWRRILCAAARRDEPYGNEWTGLLMTGCHLL